MRFAVMTAVGVCVATLLFGSGGAQALVSGQKEATEKFCPAVLDPNELSNPELAELSGVWKDGIGSEVRFVFMENTKLMANPEYGSMIYFTIADDQWAQDVVTLHALQLNPGAGQVNYDLWTLRRNWNQDRSGFTLAMLIPGNRNPLQYSYVRRFLPGENKISPTADMAGDMCRGLGFK